MYAPVVSSKPIPDSSVFIPKRPQNPTLRGGTYLYGLYKEVPPSPGPNPFHDRQRQRPGLKMGLANSDFDVRLMIRRTGQHTSTKNFQGVFITVKPTCLAIQRSSLALLFLTQNNQHRFTNVVRSHILYPVRSPQSAVLVLYLVHVLNPDRIFQSSFYTESIFYPVRSPQSVFRSPQSIFYTDQLVHDKVSDGMSERVNFQSSSILNWFITLREPIKSAVAIWPVTGQGFQNTK